MNAPDRAAVRPMSEIDMSSWWMPFTANRQFKASPRIIAQARGMYYYTPDGREVVDASAGLWCVNAGHGRQEIVDAVAAQLGTLDYAPGFNMGHPVAFEFASKLVDIAPAAFDKVFFTNSGSESVDTALKIALAYHRARGDGHRTRLIGRERGYHGVGFGGISVGGMVANRRMFANSLLPHCDHLPHTHDPERNAFSRGLPEHGGAGFADELERLVALHGDTIAAVIIEPVACSTGALVPPKGYMERLRSICDKHGILLIFDEVITGFGRLGTPFASQYFGVEPDLFTTAKGITNGAVPLGAVFMKGTIHDALMTGPEPMIELFHGYTYSGHPVACAAGLATLDIYEREKLLTRGATLEQEWADALHSLRNCPNVVDIRNLGIIGAVELAPRDGKVGARAYDAMVAAFEAGVLMRYTGDTLAMSPPLILEGKHIDRIVETTRKVLASVA
ncbi:MAG: aspartate aminotransferase family protein [Burkholderiaceae bacterium]